MTLNPSLLCIMYLVQHFNSLCEIFTVFFYCTNFLKLYNYHDLFHSPLSLWLKVGSMECVIVRTYLWLNCSVAYSLLVFCQLFGEICSFHLQGTNPKVWGSSFFWNVDNQLPNWQIHIPEDTILQDISYFKSNDVSWITFEISLLKNKTRIDYIQVYRK
jgi:hypothetical protein